MLRKSATAGPLQEYASMVDTAVYSRNRHFRLLWSTKGGKSAALRPTGRYATKLPPKGMPAVVLSLPPMFQDCDSMSISVRVLMI